MSSGVVSGPRRKLLLAVSLAAVSLLGASVGLRGAKAHAPARAPSAAPAPPAPVAPRCQFDLGETAAFSFESAARDLRAKDEDHFRGVLSWQVIEQPSENRWRLRAALSEVSQRQELTLPEERVTGSLTTPFFIDVDASCRFAGFGFAREWDARRRQLVQSMLLTHEFVLPAAPGARHWSAAQSDGLGPFQASYELVQGAQGASRRIRRHKAVYEGQARAQALGVSVAVLGSEASASFNGDHPRWLSHSSGSEHVQILIQDKVEADLIQRFRMTRDDSRYAAMSATPASEADFSDAFALEIEREQRVDFAVKQQSYEEALRAFLAHFNGTKDPSYAAARQLAAWLKSHPEAAQQLVTALRGRTIGEAARPALFLALELSGTETARSALSSVLSDRHFAAVDRARAASALSDIGTPTRASAELLLKQAQHDRSEMVVNVSMLGLGSMAKRSNDQEFKTFIQTTLKKELSSADENQVHVVLDAMGNSGDSTFANDLEAQLASRNASTRQHAAQALGHLDPAESAPRLLDQLRNETDPAVRTAIVGAFRGPPTADTLALLSEKLAASTSIEERTALITWLGAASRSQPEARSILVAQFHRETNARLMQQIGAFVPASALR